MSTTKVDISKEISINADISTVDASAFLEQFINIIKKESINKKVKISSFGSFIFNEKR